MMQILNNFSRGEIARFIGLIIGALIVIFILSIFMFVEEESAPDFVDCSKNPELAECRN